MPSRSWAVAGLVALVLLLSVALGSLAWRTLFAAP
jgi:hypothetical protein